MIAYLETLTHFIVPWPEVERLLGRPHAYTHEDDAVLFQALACSGAAVGELLGDFHDDGWRIEKPPQKPLNFQRAAPRTGEADARDLAGRTPYRG